MALAKVPPDSVEMDVLMEIGLLESPALAEPPDCVLVFDEVLIQKVLIQKPAQEELVVEERPYVVHNDPHRNVGDAGPLCLIPCRCLHAVRRHCGLQALVSAPIEGRENPGCSVQSDLN